MVSMSAYQSRILTPLRIPYHWASAESFAMKKMGAVHYSVLDFVGIWAREAAIRAELPKLAAMVPDTPGEVCSQFVAGVLKSAGVPVSSTLVSPSGLFRELSEFGILL